MRTALLAFALLSAACLSTARVGLGEPFSLAYQDGARVERLLVEFTDVLSDSRCPADVQCEQAGEATIELRLTVGNDMGGDDTQTVTVKTSGQTTASSRGYTVTLVDLRPLPTAEAPVREDRYVAELKVTRR
jgi:hypothetical protein